MKRALRKYWFALLSLVVVSAFLIFSYRSYAYFGYQSAFGGDLYNHTSLLWDLQEKGLSHLFFGFGGYPRLFHALVWGVMQLGSISNPLYAMLILLPLSVAGAGLAAGFWAAKVSGRWAGLAALVLAIIAAREPLQTLYDGGFPNYMAAAIWMPLFITTLGLALTKKGWWTAGAIGTGLLVLLTHHFSTAYLVIVLCTAALVVKKARPWLLGALVLVVLVLASPLGESIRQQLAPVVLVNSSFPWIHLIGTLDNPDAMLSWRAYPGLIGPGIFWTGMISFVSVLIAMVSRRKVPLPVILTCGWLLALLVGSHMPELRFPVRLARDLGVPLLLLSVYGVSELIKVVRCAWKPVVHRPLTLTIILAGVLAVAPQVYERITSMLQYEPTQQYSGAVAAAVADTGNELVYGEHLILPAAVHPERITWGMFNENISKKDTDMRFDTPLNDERVARVQYVMLPVQLNPPVNQAYHAFLTQEGFHQVRTYVDPNRTVILYSRH